MCVECDSRFERIGVKLEDIWTSVHVRKTGVFPVDFVTMIK